MSLSAHLDLPKRKAQLRNSCNACAASKVGCTKEKPICQRCVKRGEDCVYGTARRAGRPSEPKQQIQETRASRTVSPQAHSHPTTHCDDFCTTAERRLDGSLTNPALDVISPIGHSFAPGTSGVTACPQDSLPTALSTPDFGSFLASLDAGEDFALFDASNFGLVGSNTAVNGGDCRTRMDSVMDVSYASDTSLVPAVADFPITSPTSSAWMQSMDWSAPPLTIGRSSTSASTSSPGKPLPDLAQDSKDEACGCTARASALIVALTPCTTTGPTSFRHEATRPSLETVVFRNETALREVNAILECPCTCNESLLLDLSAVVLKTLGWYAVVVCTVAGEDLDAEEHLHDSSSHDRWTARRASTMLSGINRDTQQQGLLVCQMLLSKLNVLKSTIADLSARLLSLVKQDDQRELSHADRMAMTAQRLLSTDALTDSSGRGPSARTLDEELRGRFADLCKALVSLLQEW